MSDATKYQGYAQECMRLMSRMPLDTRAQLMDMAEAWLEMARAELNRGTAARAQGTDKPQ